VLSGHHPIHESIERLRDQGKVRFYGASIDDSAEMDILLGTTCAEVIEIHWVPFAEAYQWAMNGTIRDAKTIIALARVFAIDAVRKGVAANNP